MKLSNWGHRFDSDIDKYFSLWSNASEKNYKSYKNFNQTVPEIWPKLMLLKSKNGIKDISTIDFGINLNSISSKFWFYKMNSIWYSRFNKLVNYFKK